MFLTLKNKFPALVRASSRKLFSLPIEAKKPSQRANPTLGARIFRLIGSSERTASFRTSLLILGNLSYFSVSLLGSAG